MTSRKREDTGSGKRKYQISLSGKLDLEEVWSCRKTDYVFMRKENERI
jgi:hypothetical protein